MTESHTQRLEAALAGRYRIQRKLGEGGMASVYLAGDVKHERKVALKILRPELAAVIGAERFLAEIKTTANLQHPHILPLFDSGETDGFLYYVMPYIEGESLRERLDREQQLGMEEAVRIARDVADALDYAHRKEVIHRDIKPANILLHDGRPVVADFGIALAISAAGGGRMTETGLSLGTPHYMSPEQASADRDLSARSDVYSLGCVLYEMLAGQPPHTGPSAQSILVRILTEDPRPIGELRRSVPPHVAATVMKSIEKLPADRFESAKEFIDALGDVGFTHAAVSRAATGRAQRGAQSTGQMIEPRARLAVLLPWSLATAFAALAAWLALLPGPELPTTRSVLALEGFELSNYAGDLRISPDGRTFAAVFDVDGDDVLAVRRASEADFHLITGPADVSGVAFSPDGEWIAYGNSGEGLMKVAVSGGAPQPIVLDADASYLPLDWSAEDQVLFMIGDASTLAVRTVPATGGESVLLVEDPAFSGEFLPGGSVLLGQVGGAAFVDVDADSSWIVVPGALQPRFVAATGHLLWIDDSGAMWAAEFDPVSGALGARRGIVLEGVTTFRGVVARIDVSEAGTLVYSTGGGRGNVMSQSTLVTVTMDGTVVEESLDPRVFSSPTWSPDGRYVAYAGGEPGEDTEEPQIYTYDMQVKSRPRRLTSTGSNSFPRWSPDGTRLAFASTRDGTDGPDLFVKALAGEEPEHLLLSLPGRQQPAEWISEDRILIQSGNNGDPWIVDLPVDGSADSVTARPFFESEDRSEEAYLAPQGDLVTYSSNATGTWEVYVRSFPVAGPPEKISEGGGDFPRWSADGNTIFYWRSGRDSLWAARIERGPPFAVLATEPAVPWEGSLGSVPDLHPEGDRFVTTRRGDATPGAEAATGAEVRTFVVTNWFKELRTRLGEGGR